MLIVARRFEGAASPLCPESGEEPSKRNRCRYWGQSGHGLLQRICRLLTQSGHGTLGDANLNRYVAHPELGGGNETARFHNTIGWFRGLMAAYVACPAGGDASDRISQRWIA